MRLRARILERITVVLDNDCQYWVKIYPNTSCHFGAKYEYDAALPLQFTNAAANKVKAYR
ncbi:hypothetical protein KCP78_25260 [Salmonella enterica subsp. enterica]|nr:hypothetical protein KCP78_25260 [Salmonella enterica subsp. enterica]